MPRTIRYLLWPVGPLALLTLWQAAYSLEWFNRTLLPSPAVTGEALFRLILTGDVLPDLGVTLARTATGYFGACTVGLILGLVIGSHRPTYASLEFLIDFFRSLPVTTLYPIFVLFFGIGHDSKVAMVFAASVFVVILNSAYGALRSNPTRAQMARLYGASRWKILTSITFFDALPQSLIGMRVALSYSLIVAVVTEMFMGTQTGIGQRVFEAYSRYAIAELYALVLITGGVGYLANQVFLVFERRLVHWVPR